MKTPDLAEHVASEAGVGTSAAKKAVEAVFGGIADAAKEGERANFLGFGKSRSRTTRLARAATRLARAAIRRPVRLSRSQRSRSWASARRSR
jgi:nucleoid DNA-binding protein